MKSRRSMRLDISSSFARYATGANGPFQVRAAGDESSPDARRLFERQIDRDRVVVREPRVERVVELFERSREVRSQPVRLALAPRILRVGLHEYPVELRLADRPERPRSRVGRDEALGDR